MTELSYIVRQSLSVRMKVEGKDIADFDINQFIQLFLPSGPLHEYTEHIFGITTFNYYTKYSLSLLNPRMQRNSYQFFSINLKVAKL